MTGEQVSSDLRLLGVVGPPFIDLDAALETCLAAEAGGITALQVRWKHAAASELVVLTRALVQSLSIPVYVNDRLDVALASGATGVHLGADDLDPVRAREISPHSFRVGVSVGTSEEANRVYAANADYWSIGSIYRTDTKPDAGSPIGTEGFERLAALAPRDTPVIAIGGINASNVREILHAGASGVAVVNAVFGSHDVERSARDLITVIDDVLTARDR